VGGNVVLGNELFTISLGFTMAPPPVALTIAAAQSSTTYTFRIGAGDDLSFDLIHISAAVGDILEFNFVAANHILTKSSLEEPCVANRLFDSGLSRQPYLGRIVLLSAALRASMVLLSTIGTPVALPC